MQQFEYLTLRVRERGFIGKRVNPKKLNKSLNELGQEGWELSSSFETHEDDGETKDVFLIFKRPLS
ncbi:MAG: DUF4177 domain-containing protein [Bacteroidia bacterium]